MNELEDDQELIGRAHPVNDDDIIEEHDEDEGRMIRADLFDDDPYADSGDLDFEDEDEFGIRS